MTESPNMGLPIAEVSDIDRELDRARTHWLETRDHAALRRAVRRLRTMAMFLPPKEER